jgi:predicted transposase YbfD/YdcC
MPSSLIAVLERHSNLPRIDINALTGPPASLLDALRLVPDPRSRRGIRYPFSWLLAVCICAALSGDSSLQRIAECTKRLARGARANAPAATTIQRLLQHVDPDMLDQALAAWAATRATGAVIAIDGKELRSAKRGGHDRVHLLAALDHDTGTVLGQVNVLAKTNEITQLPILLEQLEEHRPLKGRIVTVDALHTQTKTATLSCGTYQAHYVMTIKGNQPGLYTQAESHPWDQVSVGDLQEDTSHGRIVRRELKIITPTGVLVLSSLRR